MRLSIATAPCCWGVDDPKNPHLPPWQRVLREAALAGYKSLELGPWGYLPTEASALSAALAANDLSIIAGTIFDDLVSDAHFPAMVERTHNICRNLQALGQREDRPGISQPAPYLVIIDFGNPHRAATAGQPHKAPRLSETAWCALMDHITVLSEIAWQEYGVRPVVHPHAGGCIEFADELEKLVRDIPHHVAGLCLDTGHLYYAGMDPLAALDHYWERIDYLHFKDVNAAIWREVVSQEQDFFSACAMGVMCPLGRGDIDYQAVHALLRKRRYQGWVTIEQERDPRHADGSLGDVTASLQYLQSVGF
ncbi:sugar phosphate isomerase/epimerase [Pantoea sp. Mb-10]|uniref:TIM barrel protein n=1 Tax=unclassified Pantoea TaxID=2630326 RepID=UPI001E2D007A|nr:MULTISPECIES: TIM barrel protein [unclassified Pantoea]MCE0490929.1 sugar phosphate isomerase/epimerase [Pantoea sp. Mb-10]MCE0499913.1 sugar phosphate isomerase/epimerase [Pantoea sp. Pb-8]